LHIETTAEKTCVLAEELGHYHTTKENHKPQAGATGQGLGLQETCPAGQADSSL